MEWWRERLEARPVIVMPTAPDAAEMTGELARSASGLVGQSHALTFTGLARLITCRLFGVVDEFERAVIIDGLLGSMQLEAVGEVAHLPGVAGAVGKLLQELTETGKTAEEILEALGRLGGDDSCGDLLGRDLQRLALGYWRQMETLGLTDQATLVREAISGVKGWNRPVALCGFTSFTQGQRALVDKLSRETEVMVTLDYERGLHVGLCARREAEWWIEHAEEVVDVNPEVKTYASIAIARLERGLLLADGAGDALLAEEDDGGVRFLLSSGRRREAEAIAEQIAKLIREGCDPGGIAVVVRQVHVWGRLLGDVFASCGIPYQIDERLRLGETGLGYAFLQAVRGVALDEAEAFFAFLRSPYSGVRPEDVCDLEARYRRGAPRGAKAAARSAGRRWAEVMDLLEALVEASDPRALSLTTAQALVRWMVEAAARGSGRNDGDLEADARAYRALSGGLLAVERYAAPVEPNTALRLLARTPVPTSGHVVAGAVHILDAQRARARRFDAVFIVGLAEGEFPGQVDMPSLLNPRQRAKLESLGAGLPAPEPGSERALFIGATTRAWRILYLSARDSEDDGTEVMPSRFWTEAKRLVGAEEGRHERRTLADQVYASETAPSLRHYLRACVTEGLQIHIEDGRQSAWERGVPGLCESAVLAELEAKDSFSPSALESYAGCPFAWFIERVVGMNEFEVELDGRTIGDLIHGVLTACYRSLATDGLLPLSSETVSEAEARATALIDEIVNGPDCPGTVGQRRVAACRLRAMTHRLFRAEVEAGGSLIFSEAEVEVGGTDGVDVGGLRVRGRVDRIDTSTDGQDLFVLDYKSGVAPSTSVIGDAEGLQLPLYLRALAAERQDRDVVGGAYVSLRDGVLSGVVSEGQEGILGERLGKLARCGDC